MSIWGGGSGSNESSGKIDFERVTRHSPGCPHNNDKKTQRDNRFFTPGPEKARYLVVLRGEPRKTTCTFWEDGVNWIGLSVTRSRARYEGNTSRLGERYNIYTFSVTDFINGGAGGGETMSLY